MNFPLETAIIVALIAAVTSFISAGVNIFITFRNNSLLKEIEKEKRTSEFVTYRYTKLHSILQDIENEHGFINYPDNPSKTLSEALEKRLIFVSFYKLSRPLLDSNIRVELDAAADFENEQYKLVSELVMKNKIDKDIFQKWADSVNILLESMGKSLQNQIITISGS